MLCCAGLLLLLQFTEMVMGRRRAEGVSSPRSSVTGVLSSKMAEAAAVAAAAGANGHTPGKDDTAMVN